MSQLEAMLLSVLIEAPIACAVVRFARWPCRGPLHVAAAAALATAVTHPQLWAAALWLYPRIGYWPTIGLAETAVIVAEAAILLWATGLAPLRSLTVSAVANGASALAGIVSA